VLLDQVTEYELGTDPPELALTVVRSVGQISRDVHRYRDEPAGPQTPTPGAQCLGPVAASLAVQPHAGPWHQDGVLTQMECFRHDLLTAAGAQPAGPPGDAPPPSSPGLAVEGAGVTLSALRRRGDWLELRLAAQHPAPAAATVTVGGRLVAAREADLLGRPGDDLPVAGDTLRLNLAAWEIRTVQLQLAPEDRP
jgi:alpha-mannosidase